MVFSAEPRGPGDLGHGVLEIGLERVAHREVGDIPARGADEVVVVVIGEVFGQLEARQLIAGHDAVDHAARLQERQVPIGRALRQGTSGEDLCRRQGPPGLLEDLDEAPTARGVSLPVVFEQFVDRTMEISSGHDPKITGTVSTTPESGSFAETSDTCQPRTSW